MSEPQLLTRKRQFGRSTCFLCSRRLGSRSRSEEHVFPKWLLRRFGLHNHKLTLLNRTTLHYRQLTVPCCRDCNTDHLGALESRISAATEGEVPEVRKLGWLPVYLWLGKILFGVLYKEYLLAADRTGGHPGRMVPREMLADLDLHHLFLQATHSRMKFLDQPGSVLVLPIQEHPVTEKRFSLRAEE